MDLSKLPVTLDKISKPTIQQIETERRMFWKRFFQKIEASYDSSDETEAIEDIDDPQRVEEREQRVQSFCEIPSSMTFRRWCRDNGDYFDELTTIAGPPAEDEEDIGEEEDEAGDNMEDIEETWSQTSQSDEEPEVAGMEEVDEEVDEKIRCTKCGRLTIYDPDITEDEEKFACDLCLLGLHPECVEDCNQCRNIASKVERRWRVAEVDDPVAALQALQRQ